MPPLVTDINLAVDDTFLYVSCWGTGELKQNDVSDPAHPREAGSVRFAGITGRVEGHSPSRHLSMEISPRPPPRRSWYPA